MSPQGNERTKLLHRSKNETRVSYTLESGPKFLWKLDEIVAVRESGKYSNRTFAESERNGANDFI